MNPRKPLANPLAFWILQRTFVDRITRGRGVQARRSTRNETSGPYLLIEFIDVCDAHESHEERRHCSVQPALLLWPDPGPQTSTSATWGATRAVVGWQIPSRMWDPERNQSRHVQWQRTGTADLPPKKGKIAGSRCLRHVRYFTKISIFRWNRYIDHVALSNHVTYHAARRSFLCSAPNLV